VNAPAFSFRNLSAGGIRDERGTDAEGSGGARGRAGLPLLPGEGPTGVHVEPGRDGSGGACAVGGGRGRADEMAAMTGQGRPLRPDDDRCGPWDGLREDGGSG
jgi:hypothetical protein